MDIRSTAATLCRLMGVPPPHQSTSDVQTSLFAALEREGIKKIDKCLVYAPDAIGRTIQERYPDYFTDIRRFIKYTQPLTSVCPSVTPVCFSTMFSGAAPEIHGIQTYVKPVIKIETIFDVMPAAGKKTAIISINNCSIDLIFRERPIDYFTMENDREVMEKALEVFKKYDFLVVYNDEYDKFLHRTHPYSSECLTGLRHHNESFAELYQAVRQKWAGYNWLLAYTPDHGAHFNEIDRIGTHGKDIPEDMELLHHYAFSAKTKMLEKYDKTKHSSKEVMDLLGMAVGHPTPERLHKLLEVVYEFEGHELYVNTDEGRITGVIGVDNSTAPHGWILHLAVAPDYRRRGIGRNLIDNLVEMLALSSVGLETDRNAVGFYRACGFKTNEIDGPWPGVPRFRCTKGNPPPGVLEYYGNRKLIF